MRRVRVFGVTAVLAFGMLFATAGSAHAAAALCPALPGANADGLKLSDVTFRGGNADACYGISTTGSGGNPSLSELNGLWGTGGSNAIFGPDNFVQVVKLDDDNSFSGSKVLGGYTFTITAPDAPGDPGPWTFNISGGVYPETLDIVVALKAQPKHAYYLFDNETFDAAGLYNGTYSVAWNGDISNLTVYARNGTPSASGGGSQQAVIPEPASLLLLGTGLSAAAWRSRRKKQSQ